ncbi:MAG: NAD(P)-dependent oxidoreductase [Pseudohongiellaceae bacterium]
MADQDIVALDSHFKRYGELVKLPGRRIDRNALSGADILLVRSVTRVDQALLEGTPVQFVASATSGTDHIDIPWLAAQGIGFASAAGANANAVVEYCLTALAYLTHTGFNPAHCSVGIIGAGSVGGLFARRLLALGCRVLICDPLLSPPQREALAAQGAQFGDFRQTLQNQLVSFHVPLVSEGAYATWHMLDEKGLKSLPSGAVLMNTSRGEVIDNQVLYKVMSQREDLQVVLDVWEGEPEPMTALIGRAAIATPHIAGYSLEAKLRATTMIAGALDRHFQFSPHVYTNSNSETRVSIELQQQVCSTALCPEILTSVFAIEALSEKFKALSHSELAAGFDRLRKQQVNRREFSAYRLPPVRLNQVQRDFLADLGFAFAN